MARRSRSQSPPAAPHVPLAGQLTLPFPAVPLPLPAGAAARRAQRRREEQARAVRELAAWWRAQR